ncbi:Zinc finger transcription factor [Komagataella phaffii CBS 7435]|uniref:Homodimeric Zn2Cys6 zinc finger transcription factor n=2 Tax=Komagataella phaffii TaxID=460519 RepID=C4R0W9_KOMPG|nr:Homodimeric Zn2Cys6 zinc finger transcription factor [Komagataella phaffii GS115]AOA62169.1 GQ67_00559T0 [Komagataella phaffii]CAH2448335.1 Zinc finger transcription factor [Komagataella phaffii CBS 7435]AOA67086.1 GQ68_00829T0 [Komagataella phaffii GS115]CAY69143.1 Homodimeric Zn2Cys6 zinc finger transcription factor [Komagataella phaffii GS115]CCA38467.1 Zinc finger transcription factor [Komagataella phaffii CBS 7435]
MSNVEDTYHSSSETPEIKSPTLNGTTSDTKGNLSGSALKRRAVACKSCHSLKVKCVPVDVNDPGGPCIRCEKAKRECKIDVSQLRKKKTKKVDKPSTSTTDLEKKVIFLENELRKQKAINSKLGYHPGNTGSIPQVYPINSPQQFGNASVHSDNSSAASQNYIPQQQKVYLNPEGAYQDELNLLDDIYNAVDRQKISEVRSLADTRTSYLENRYSKEKYNVIKLGILTIEEAEERLHVFNTKLHKKFPFVDIPFFASIDEFMNEQPILFITVMSITSMCVSKSVDQKQMYLDQLAIQAITAEILIIGKKTLELLKSLLLLNIWYNTPELFDHRRYHIFNSLCEVMVSDLGLTNLASYFFSGEEGIVKKSQRLSENDTIECRALLLMVFSTSVCTSLFLRRPIRVVWSEYLEQSCALLESSNESKYRYISLYGRLNHILEKIYHAIHSHEDPISSECSSSRIRYTINQVQLELNQIKLKINNDPYLGIYYYSVQAYLYEPELQKFATIHSLVQGSTQLPHYVVNSIDLCAQSCFSAIRLFCSLAPEDVAVLPLFYSSRVIYTSGMLLRLRYLTFCIPSLSNIGIVPKEYLYEIKRFTEVVVNSAREHPGNVFLGKQVLIIALFLKTSISQVTNWRQMKLSLQMASNVGHQKQEPDQQEPLHERYTPEVTTNQVEQHTEAPNRAYLTSPTTWAPRTQSQGYHPGSPLEILSNAAEMHDLNKNYTEETDTNKPTDFQKLFNSNDINSFDQDPSGTQSDKSLEMSYWALSDEFWSDLLVPADLNMAGHVSSEPAPKRL